MNEQESILLKYSLNDYERNLRERIFEQMQMVHEDIMARIAEDEERLASLESRVRTLEEDQVRDAIIFNASKHHLTPEEYLKGLAEWMGREGDRS